MTSLLHLDSSASDHGDSVTRQLTALYADTWRCLHGSAGYRYRDLAAEPVPLVSPAFVSLGIRVERRGTVALPEVAELTEGPAEEREWALTLPLIAEMRAAETVLVGVPMYNYSVPASLKAWIDRVTFPGAFLDPRTGDHLLRRTNVVVVTARGGSYAPGTPREDFDFQTPYLRAYFTDLGVAPENLCFVSAEMTRASDVPALARFKPLAADSLAAARSAVSGLAGRAARSGAAARTR
ncbi:FMN-dependent NADH-azoreductase [Microbispora amethystogenes]|uniref:FMN dependent NADH:quinone oxidoreductase n=1 Tax=Microbispora amethystogenes TaxID=1427754 RepID=A0ABQ4F543_9ACTN|nr:NAD(P)H-dependent oxidoreductase [Microbispora amethystogenes]GIH29920.1 FMN-dependent NADH-azoreductase [Microbispora amethystogenes]